MPSQKITILSERVLTTSPAPGDAVPTVALSYHVPPRPPGTLFIEASELPDVAWSLEHPDDEQVPEDLRKQGDKVRREKVLAAIGRVRTTQARKI